METARIIRIKSCSDCPNGFTNLENIPSCRGTKPVRKLPYETNKGYRGRGVAWSVPKIPEWCPLEILQQG